MGRRTGNCVPRSFAFSFSAGGGVCTLRAAIQETNALAGADTIILPSLPLPNAYFLLVVDSLIITDSLTIAGGGAVTTVIDGNKSVRSSSGVLVLSGGATVNISGVTIRNGASGASGGGIFNAGTVTLTNSTVSGNNATGSAVNLGDGGGIFHDGAAVTLTDSTVSGNSARGSGGGIFVGFLSANTVNSFNSTITDNLADANLDFAGAGGGVFVSGGTLNFQNTILAGNSVLGFPTPTIASDCAGTVNSSGNNLMRTLASCTVNGGGVTVAAPQLGPLQNNGGPTQTHALLAGSPAIDAGNPSGCRDQFGALLVKDQRGFRRAVDGNRDGTPRCDIGAVEFGSGAGVTFYSDVDFDGDGRNDIGVYRDGMWFVLQSSNGGVTQTGWGRLPQDIPLNRRSD